MTISTYANLTTALTTNWPARGDLTSTNSDEFIALAEAMFNMRLRCRQMEAVSSLTPTTNVYTLPTDYIEAKRVVEVASIRRRLVYMTEDAVDAMYPDRASGLSSHYTIIGSSLYTYPLSSNNVELLYYQRIPALSGSNTTNWLLTAYPNLYLHACLAQMGEYIQDMERVAAETNFVERYIDMIQAADTRAKFANAGVTLPGVVW